MQKRFARLCICANIREVAQWNASGRGNAALPGRVFTPPHEEHHSVRRSIVTRRVRNLANLSRAKDSVPELINH